MESLLAAYSESMGCTGPAVPAELVQAAVRISDQHAVIGSDGPSDAVHKGEGQAAAAPCADEPEMSSAGVIDGSGESWSPIQLWDQVMRNYGVYEDSTRLIDLYHADASRGDRVAKAKADQATAIAAAVEALAQLSNREARAQLRKFDDEQSVFSPVVPISQTTELLSQFHPSYWTSGFLDLFFRGDCIERDRRRTMHGIHPSAWDKIWAKCLIQRADFRGWQTSVEFVACLYNVLLRRSQMRAVQIEASKMSNIDADKLAMVTARDIVACAQGSGECETLRAILKRVGLDEKLNATFRHAQAAMRNVRGSEASKGGLRLNFTAMRIWNGCSSLFFTLNPYARQPLTIALCNGEQFHVEHFSLDWSDEDMASFFDSTGRQRPRLLYDIAAEDPVAITRAFHYTVRLVLEELGNCCPPASCGVQHKSGKKSRQHYDTVPARLESGIFGGIAGYLGVVEPQLRKMLHLHMLVQLLGFAHPDDIFKRGNLKDMIKRVWSFVSSICFRSSEAFARYLSEDSAVDALKCAPLMPLSEKQRCMIGPQRTQESYRAQLKAREMKEPCPAEDIISCKYETWTPAAYRSRSWYKSRDEKTDPLPSSVFAAVAVRDVHAATLSFGNHVCKPRVCHKGRIGRMGFCRMMFWHWAKVPRKISGKRKRDNAGDGDEYCAKRQHGLALQPRWLEGSPPVHMTPPQIGIPGLEVNQPFHYRMTPGIAMGPRCNHDLGILLRVPALKSEEAVLETVDGEELRESELSIDAMIEALIDHEFYCVSYSTKEEPLIVGLLHSFADGVRNIDLEIARRRAEGEVVENMEHARKLLHRLLHSTNRRMHKGFPEMISYILQKPDHYASHSLSLIHI